jgi:hypothetical protein
MRLNPLSHALRPALFVLLALSHDGGAETAAQFVRQFVKLGVTINFDGFLGGVTNHIAVVAPGKVVFKFDLGLLVEDAVQIIGQLV